MSESLSKSLESLEMWYSTYGTYGQHTTQHPLFMLGIKLLTADEAVAEGICTVEIQDNHSRKNVHYKRTYKLVKPVDAIIIFTCYASSSRHEHNIKVVFGSAEIQVDVEDGEEKGYVINKKWFLANCQATVKPKIIPYIQVLQQREIKRQKEQLKAMEEERKKTMPRITVNTVDNKLIISGETYYIREAIKVVAGILGSKAMWDQAKKAWIIASVDKNVFTTKLQELVPQVVIEC